MEGGGLVARDPEPGDAVVLLGEGKHVGIVRKAIRDPDGRIVKVLTIEDNTTADGQYGASSRAPPSPRRSERPTR